jgi:hypothetical protein
VPKEHVSRSCYDLPADVPGLSRAAAGRLYKGLGMDYKWPIMFWECIEETRWPWKEVSRRCW